MRPDDASDAAGSPRAPRSAFGGMVPGRLTPGRLLTSDDDLFALLRRTHRIAVVGIKIAATGAPAFYVPEYMQRAGWEIVPVPVYFPDVTEILGERVYRTVSAIPGAVDLVNLFRLPRHIPPHIDDIIAKRPLAVWMQEGIRHAGAAARFTAEGIDVVQDRCLMVDARRMGR
jgi:uncharacterized protein